MFINPPALGGLCCYQSIELEIVHPPDVASFPVESVSVFRDLYTLIPSPVAFIARKPDI